MEPNKVDPADPYASLEARESYEGLGPKDEEVVHEIQECQRHINKLRALKEEDEDKFEDEMVVIQQIAAGKKMDPTAPVSQAMAEAILLEFEQFDFNPESHRRGEINAILAALDDEPYMGKTEDEEGPTFIPLAEAGREMISDEDSSY